MARKSDDPRAAAVEAVDRRLADKEASVRAATERHDASQPTPTQRENDLAKVGALNIDEKEDDGSGPDANALNFDHNADDPYATRDMDAGESGTNYSRRSSAKSGKKD